MYAYTRTRKSWIQARQTKKKCIMNRPMQEYVFSDMFKSFLCIFFLIFVLIIIAIYLSNWQYMALDTLKGNTLVIFRTTYFVVSDFAIASLKEVTVAAISDKAKTQLVQFNAGSRSKWNPCKHNRSTSTGQSNSSNKHQFFSYIYLYMRVLQLITMLWHAIRYHTKTLIRMFECITLIFV